MAEVVWEDAAIADLDEVADYIRQFDPVAAERLKARLLRTVNLLRTAPLIGRTIPGGRRQIGVRPYLIRFRVSGDVVRSWKSGTWLAGLTFEPSKEAPWPTN